jgi:cytochrome P450
VAPQPDPDTRPRVAEEIYRFLQDLIRDQGDIAEFRGPYGPVTFFNHPDDVQAVLHRPNYGRSSLLRVTLGQGLLSTDGDLWRSQRRLMQPLFSDERLAAFAGVVIERTLALVRRWDADGLRDGAPVDLAAEMRRLTLEVVVQGLFTADLGDEAGEWVAAFEVLLDHLGELSTTQFDVPLRFAPGHQARFQHATRVTDANVERLIARRRAQHPKPDDLLSRLLDARDAATGQPLDERQIRDEMVTLLLAGHETTAVGLAWTWYLLSRHPDVEERLRAEIDQVLGGRVPAMADLPALPYARMVFEESMRVYPPVCFVNRFSEADDEIRGHRVPAGRGVLLSPWTTHRHPAFWDDPDRFDPERFTAERSRRRHRYAFFPFGGGRHHCIGRAFAMLEGPLVLILLLQRCRFRSLTDRPVEPRPLISLQLKGGVMVTVERCEAPSGRVGV